MLPAQVSEKEVDVFSRVLIGRKPGVKQQRDLFVIPRREHRFDGGLRHGRVAAGVETARRRPARARSSSKRASWLAAALRSAQCGESRWPRSVSSSVIALRTRASRSSASVGSGASPHEGSGRVRTQSSPDRVVAQVERLGAPHHRVALCIAENAMQVDDLGDGRIGVRNVLRGDVRRPRRLSRPHGAHVPEDEADAPAPPEPREADEHSAS